ncbi:MAG: hypothetical protein A2Y17_02785 [Clostridiales bacterium GWF2_38_85]|nr:MAG: hypothetical protein A2Y17_02785 [Clostridiales bacterium GWF2_38_85]HBL85455.1 hypothetical protein [Clostridiales bacterium]
MKYYIGIDGGGTKTAAVTQSEDKTIKQNVLLPGSNHYYCGMDESLAIVRRAVEELTAKVGASFEEVASVFVGIAGATSDNYIGICTEMLEKLLPNAKVGVNTDAANLLALFDGDGVVLICGTGSICFSRKSDQLKRIGGHADLDPSGSGTHIGKAAIMLSLQVYDGREPDCILNEMVEKKLGDKAINMTTVIPKYDRSQIAAFAPLVFDAARQGDKAALKILDQNIEYLAHMVNTAAGYLSCNSFPLIVSGGIFRDELTMPILKKYLKCAPEIRFADSQVEGALRAARNLI